jgi:hypothetical protein
MQRTNCHPERSEGPALADREATQVTGGATLKLPLNTEKAGEQRRKLPDNNKRAVADLSKKDRQRFLLYPAVSGAVIRPLPCSQVVDASRFRD